ncbi:MAG TPA: RidA family protein [Micromonospora sp.]
MANVTVLNPAQLGPAIAPYSQAAIANGFIHIAGQVALDPENNVVAPNDPKAQTTYALGRIRTILAEVGATLNDIVSATVFITDLKHFGPFNEAWAAEFGDHRPARATVVAGLLLPGLVVEIQAVAALPQ